MSALLRFEEPQPCGLERALAQIASIARDAIGETAPPLTQRSAFSLKSPLDRARSFYAARRRRDRTFGEYADLFSDPAWDLMLELFVAYHDKRQVSIKSACGAAYAAPTTALRYLTRLEERGLIERSPDHTDGRRYFITLSAVGLTSMTKALADR